MEYKLIRRHGQKTLRMHFNCRGELIVSVPYLTPPTEVEDFVEKNCGWIEKHLQNNESHDFKNGDWVFLLGEKFPVRVENDSKDSILIEKHEMIFKSCKTDTEHLRKMYVNFCNNYLKYQVPILLQKYCVRIGLSLPALKIVNAKSRWGVCYSKRREIRISTMCAALPFDLLEMIVLHEVCHLRFANHRMQFWKMMEEYMPDIKERKKKMKEFERTGNIRNIF